MPQWQAQPLAGSITTASPSTTTDPATVHLVSSVALRRLASRAVTVASGFGCGADWFRNVTAGGPVAVDLGRGARAADHEVLALDEAEQLMLRYERNHRLAAPVLRRALSAMVGWRYEGTAEQRGRLVEQLPVVRFTPARTDRQAP